MKFLLSIIVFINLSFFGFSQQRIIDTNTIQDQNGQGTIESDTTTLSVMARLAKMSEEMNGMILSLESHMNTSAVEENLADIEVKLAYSDSYLGHYQHHYSYRVLRSHTVLLEQIRLKLHTTGIMLSKINQQFITTEKSIVAFSGDSSFRQIPEDTAMRLVYINQYHQLANQWRYAAEINKKRMLQLAILQDRLSENYLKWSSLHTHLKMRMESFSGNFLNKIEGPLMRTQSKQYEKSFPEVFRISIEAAIAIFLYYSRAHWLSMVVVILVCYLVSAWIIFIRQQFKKNISEYNTSNNVFLHYLSASPILTSLLLTFTFSPFFFATPPGIFVESIWTLNGLIVSILFYYDKRLPASFKAAWIIFFLLFSIVGLLGLQLYNTLEERWMLVMINIAFIIVEAIAWRINNKHGIFVKRLTGMLIFFSMGLHLTSILANFTGYFNLAKIVTNSATFSVFTGALLKVFIDSVGEALGFQLAYLRRNFQDEKVFQDLYNAVTKLVKWLALVSWLLFLLGSLNLLDKVKSELLTQLSSPYRIGDTSVTIGSILLFVFIIWLAATLSKLVSLLTEITTKSGTRKYMNIRNAKLFLRLIIITTGVLLAFAATGLPIDRIAIILGALSVGIGFGLQNLVSNLVAGVMISIEHPVRIGDTIDIGMHTGVIREIGFRSIHILTPGGADVVVPNAELLSQHVVNWTMSNKHKRLEIVVPVNAKLDLHFVKDAIHDVLVNHPRVMPLPMPEVMINNFLRGGGAIEMIEYTCYFWCENLANISEVKSIVMEDIYHRIAAMEAKT